ncbi:APC family permease [Wolbachia endosymbiont of Dirofilaria (Dirofilaria) immitis]|uniref:APC family permease n=1 Tax=Wolbachia endosymbiont of Dirofilaria (Dirofilaria) immitis TaxID=1812115 RepID=UPI0015894F9D|nr:amino acid permease [Wolbachia endosymbiont of Dirofilaria (Dirofilaria) immitis]QKX02557.1 amino acid permease [Wolbachia endosymbiont of Dirofilaria (Dirofilaria) immitis]
MSDKIGFLTVFALVISSQIGSGIFMLPISLAPYGIYSPMSWMISGLGAIFFALVFAFLCAKFPKTGGPHVYVKYAFGSTVAFFIGWTYWISSWVSSTAVTIASIGYLAPLFYSDMQNIRLLLEVVLILAIMLINLRGVTTAGRVELLLTIIKIIALLTIPMAALFFFDRNNFIISEELSSFTTSQILAHSTLLALWCFVGLESVTASAGSVNNPGKTIPRAIVLGTICVAVIYFINNFAIMGLISGNDLADSRAPYADAVKIMFQGNWHVIVSVVAFIVSVSNLNTWFLADGQIALGLAEDKLMPRLFTRRNKYDAPFYGIMLSTLGVIVLLVLTSNKNFVEQVTLIIDVSVVSFLFIYLVSSFAFLKIAMQEKIYCKLLIGGVAILFCCWIIYEIPIRTLLMSSLFPLSVTPIYLLWYRKSIR